MGLYARHVMENWREIAASLPFPVSGPQELLERMGIRYPPAAREVAKMSGQTSAIQRYWRGRIQDFPTAMPEGFDARWWEMLSRHVLDGESMGDLALEWGITKRRVQVLLEKGSNRLKEVVDAE
jgi:hypothetical protein